MRCTELPPEEPEESPEGHPQEFDSLGRPVERLAPELLSGWISETAPDGSMLILEEQEAILRAEAAVAAAAASRKPWERENVESDAEVQRRRLREAENAGRRAAQEPEQVAALEASKRARAVVEATLTPEEHEAREAAKRRAVEEAEMQRKAAAAAQASRSQAAVERQRKVAEAEAARLAAEAAEAVAAAAQMPIGFDLIMREQQGEKYEHA